MTRGPPVAQPVGKAGVPMTPQQGEIWRWETEHVKARPVLIVTRSDGVPSLSDILVAPITRTIRGIPTEVELGADEGLHHQCAAAFDNVFGASRVHLAQRMGALPIDRRDEMCDAMRAVLDC
jgi:mRNA interferase MazF